MLSENNKFKVLLTAESTNPTPNRLKLENGVSTRLFNIKILSDFDYTHNVEANLELKNLNDIDDPEFFTGLSSKDLTFVLEEDLAPTIGVPLPILTFDNIRFTNDTEDYVAGAPFISDFSPKVISVGESKVLTIKGYNFGKERTNTGHQVLFRSPTSNGRNVFGELDNVIDFLDEDVYTWSDREIKVVLNSSIKSETRARIKALSKYDDIDIPFETSPGSGFFRVQVDKSNEFPLLFLAIGWSNEPIDVNYGLVSGEFVNGGILPTPVLANEGSAIKFHLGPEMAQNAAAVTIIEQVFKDLNCAVAANLILDVTGTIQPTGANLSLEERYNTNVIEFGSLTGNAVGKVFRTQRQCPDFPSTGYNLYTTIVIDPEDVTDFSVERNVALEGQNAFIDVFTHELGHALGLVHVSEYTGLGISSESFENGFDMLRGVSRMMGTTVQSAGQPLPDIFEPTFIDGLTSALALSASLDITNLSTCSGTDVLSTFVLDSRGNELNGCGLNGFSGKNAISLINVFPNPSDGLFEIDSKKHDIDEILVYDLQGRLIMSTIDEEIDGEIDLSDIDKGIYLLNIYENGKILFNDKVSIY